jgi:hypothetical protein
MADNFKMLEVQIFGNDSNKSKLDWTGNQEEVELQ